MQDAGAAARPRFVVRPSPGQLLKAFVESNDGRGLGMAILFGGAGVIFLGKSSLPLAVLAGAALAFVVVGTAMRLRYEVVGQDVKIGNIARTNVIPMTSIRGIGVQPVRYEDGGTRYRVMVTTDRVDKKGRPVQVPSIATERKQVEDVHRIIEETARVLSASATMPATPAPVPAAPVVVATQAPTTSTNGARWLPDPTNRHQQRYWDGERWTGHVSDGGVVGSDPLAG